MEWGWWEEFGWAVALLEDLQVICRMCNEERTECTHKKAQGFEGTGEFRVAQGRKFVCIGECQVLISCRGKIQV